MAPRVVECAPEMFGKRKSALLLVSLACWVWAEVPYASTNYSHRVVHLDFENPPRAELSEDEYRALQRQLGQAISRGASGGSDVESAADFVRLEFLAGGIAEGRRLGAALPHTNELHMAGKVVERTRDRLVYEISRSDVLEPIRLVWKRAAAEGR